MGPQRDIRAGDVAPQDVQPLVPVVELLRHRRFRSAAPAQPKHLHVVVRASCARRVRSPGRCTAVTRRRCARAAVRSRDATTHGWHPASAKDSGTMSVFDAGPRHPPRSNDQRTVAARPPEAQIAEQRRQTRAAPEQQQIEEAGIARAQQHTNPVNRQAHQQGQQIPGQQETPPS